MSPLPGDEARPHPNALLSGLYGFLIAAGQIVREAKVAVFRQQRIDRLAAMGPKGAQRALLIVADQARKSRHVGGHDGRQPPLCAFRHAESLTALDRPRYSDLTLRR